MAAMQFATVQPLLVWHGTAFADQDEGATDCAAVLANTIIDVEPEEPVGPATGASANDGGSDGGDAVDGGGAISGPSGTDGSGAESDSSNVGSSPNYCGIAGYSSGNQGCYPGSGTAQSLGEWVAGGGSAGPDLSGGGGGGSSQEKLAAQQPLDHAGHKLEHRRTLRVKALAQCRAGRQQHDAQSFLEKLVTPVALDGIALTLALHKLVRDSCAARRCCSPRLESRFFTDASHQSSGSPA